MTVNQGAAQSFILRIRPAAGPGEGGAEGEEEGDETKGPESHPRVVLPGRLEEGETLEQFPAIPLFREPSQAISTFNQEALRIFETADGLSLLLPDQELGIAFGDWVAGCQNIKRSPTLSDRAAAFFAASLLEKNCLASGKV